MQNEDNDAKSTRRKAAAEFIAIETSRLARMANANAFPLLAHLLDMAVLEAWREASGEPPAGSGNGSGDV